MIWSVHPNEVDYVAEKMLQIMTKDIVKHYTWITVPLVADIEVTPVDASWYYKTDYKIGA
jgi:hypothetical protein